LLKTLPDMRRSWFVNFEPRQQTFIPERHTVVVAVVRGSQRLPPIENGT
jgi:hypothetical protein